MGVDNDIYDVICWDIRSFSVACMLRFKPKNLVFWVISVYGSPYEEGKEEFISELHPLFLDSSVPLLLEMILI
jgi:hypothetical protein